jgi:hypothetical protein
MEASAAAVKATASTAMKTATATAMKAAATATMETAATAVTAASVLSECGICCECKTDESSKCDQRSAKTECAHNLYLPPRTWESTFERRAYCGKDGALLYEILPPCPRLRGFQTKSMVVL